MLPESQKLIEESGISVKLIFTDIDPFNVAFSDQVNDIIYIDKRFRHTSIEVDLLRHEIKHFKNRSMFHDPIGKDEGNTFLKVLRKKPLILFQFIFPFMIARTEAKPLFKVDFWALAQTIVFAVVVAFFFSAGTQTIICEPSSVIPPIKDCITRTCTILGGCVTNSSFVG